MAAGHVLVIPQPAQGHIIPLLDLAYHLSTRGISITVLVTPKNLPLLSPILSRSPSVQTLVFPFPDCPSIPSGVENVKDLPQNASVATLTRALSQLREPITSWFVSHPDPPGAIISDFFLGWTEDLALQLGIPRFVFYSSGAFLVSMLNHLLAPDHRPGSTPLPHFEYRHLPALYRRCSELGSPGSDWEFMKEGMIANRSSFGGIYNTYSALERTYLDHVSREGGHERTWAVGPLSVGTGGPTGRGGSSSIPERDVMAWLDKCEEGSVVYVCFGSEVLLKKRQMEELAAGLERSGAPFIWSVKVPTSVHTAGEYGVVPDGFEERVAGRGLVIKGWAPQVAILEHRAVGAFLTHCGWNSVLEGLVAGAMLLAWPMGADQFQNAWLLVEEAGVAVQVCEGLETVPDSTELARAIAESLSGNRSERVRALELKKATLEAVAECGSSYKDLDDLVKELFAISSNKKNKREKAQVA